MRLDRYDIAPLLVIVVFGFAIPFATWMGLSTRHQMAQDLRNLGAIFGVIVGSFVLLLFLLIGYWNMRMRRHERRIWVERGEQTQAEFVSLFTSEAEQQAAELLYPRIQRMTATGHLPLRVDDNLTEGLLNIDPDDWNEEIQHLCERLNVCTALNPSAEAALYGSNTVGQLVAALAVFLKEQVPSS